MISASRRHTMRNVAAVGSRRLGERNVADRRYIMWLMAGTRDELARADAKAVRWMAAAGAMCAAGITSVLGRTVQTGLIGRWFCCVAVCLGLLAVGVLTAVVFPRCGSDDRETVSYFGDVHRLGDPEHVRRRISRTVRGEISSLVGELCAVSRIAATKYRLLKVGILLTGLTCSSLAVMVVDGLWRLPG